MTITEFNCLTTAERADYLSQSGPCHFSRMNGCYYVNVFVLKQFTAEAWYDTSLGYVEKITAYQTPGLADFKPAGYFNISDLSVKSSFSKG